MSNLIAKEYRRFEDIKKYMKMVWNIGVRENLLTQNGEIFKK